ncbi:MAG: hypothetical protein ACKOCT_22435 [Alphaproteobacteria bacterium]
MISRRTFSLFAASGALFASSRAGAQVQSFRRPGIAGTYRVTGQSHSTRQRSAFDPETGPLDPAMVVRSTAVTWFTVAEDLSAETRILGSTSAVNVVGAATGAPGSAWASRKVESTQRGQLVPVSGADALLHPDSGIPLIYDFVLATDGWLSQVVGGPESGRTFAKRLDDRTRLFARVHFSPDFTALTSVTPRSLDVECECGLYSSRTFDAVGLKVRS